MNNTRSQLHILSVLVFVLALVLAPAAPAAWAASEVTGTFSPSGSSGGTNTSSSDDENDGSDSAAQQEDSDVSGNVSSSSSSSSSSGSGGTAGAGADQEENDPSGSVLGASTASAAPALSNGGVSKNAIIYETASASSESASDTAFAQLPAFNEERANEFAPTLTPLGTENGVNAPGWLAVILFALLLGGVLVYFFDQPRSMERF